jgi:hypothetical protein
MKLKKLSKSTKMGLLALLGVGAIVGTYRLGSKLGYIVPISLWGQFLCESCQQETAYHQPPSGNILIAADRPLAKLLGANVDKSRISISIEKSKYRLTVYQDRQPIKSYPIVLGTNPTGDKSSEGDRRTPEGIFYLRDLYPHPQWSKFLWLDYPNARSWHKHFAAKKSGEIPVYASVGSDVGIHGVPANSDKLIDNRINWTWGCISLKNADIDEIYAVSRSGTLVEIFP